MTGSALGNPSAPPPPPALDADLAALLALAKEIAAGSTDPIVRLRAISIEGELHAAQVGREHLKLHAQVAASTDEVEALNRIGAAVQAVAAKLGGSAPPAPNPAPPPDPQPPPPPHPPPPDPPPPPAPPPVDDSLIERLVVACAPTAEDQESLRAVVQRALEVIASLSSPPGTPEYK